MSPQLAGLVLGSFLAGCTAPPESRDAPTAPAGQASPFGAGDPAPSAEALERGRLDPSWHRYVPMQRGEELPVPEGEAWEDIAVETVNARELRLPVHGDVSGPSVAHLQILLDRAAFSPGVIDGRWGKNVEKAVYWLQRREGLPPTGQPDEATVERLRALAGDPDELVVAFRLGAEDVDGPFVEMPRGIAARAALDCLCYASRAEQIAERFHTSEALLLQLNPGTDLEQLGAGDVLFVPNVRELRRSAVAHAKTATDATDADPADTAEPVVARILVSDGGGWLQAFDERGVLLYHFPATLGSRYAPSPEGDLEVVGVAWMPEWRYSADGLGGVPDAPREAILPPGPNSAVGVVWMALSKPSYGIHGTSAPESIGYATSHGCVRLTNWDAVFLASRLEPGVPVRFADVSSSRSSRQRAVSGR